MKHYFNCLKKYATFSGRASRSEYWVFTIINIVIFMILMIIYCAFIYNKAISHESNDFLEAIILCTLILFISCTITPSLAVFTRRMHDINKSGWWFLIAFIPFFGQYIMANLLHKQGDEGENKYGKRPSDAIETENKSQKNKNTVYYILIIIIAVLGIGGYVLYNNNNKHENSYEIHDINNNDYLNDIYNEIQQAELNEIESFAKWWVALNSLYANCLKGDISLETYSNFEQVTADVYEEYTSSDLNNYEHTMKRLLENKEYHHYKTCEQLLELYQNSEVDIKELNGKYWSYIDNNSKIKYRYKTVYYEDTDSITHYYIDSDSISTDDFIYNQMKPVEIDEMEDYAKWWITQSNILVDCVDEIINMNECSRFEKVTNDIYQEINSSGVRNFGKSMNKLLQNEEYPYFDYCEQLLVRYNNVEVDLVKRKNKHWNYIENNSKIKFRYSEDTDFTNERFYIYSDITADSISTEEYRAHRYHILNLY